MYVYRRSQLLCKEAHSNLIFSNEVKRVFVHFLFHNLIFGYSSSAAAEYDDVSHKNSW